MVGRWTSQPEPVRLVGNGLVLREWTESDLDRMTELFDEPTIDRWTPLPSPFDLEAAHRYLEQARERHREDLAVQLAITQDGGLALGEVLLFDRGAAVGEVGYSVGLRYRGRGLAGRAVRLLVDRAGREWGFEWLRLRIEPENGPSVGVAVACGFAPVAGLLLEVESKGRRIRLASWERDPRPEATGRPSSAS